ncbi:MAG TPA: BON domain-containing protein [Planctomycetota bacterium]|nr:BON domain-containing protein [Planctomycetota bacterium]
MRGLATIVLMSALGASAFATPSSVETLVREDLMARPYLGAGWVRPVVSDETRVRLQGRVPDERFRTLLGLATEHVAGVTSVTNELAVDPALPPRQLRPSERDRVRLENARKALRADPELEPYSTLQVTKTLHGFLVTGAVEKRSQRQKIAVMLGRFRGATIENRVVVRPNASRRGLPGDPDPDARALAREVAVAIRAERLLDGQASAEVAAEGGTLVLRGEARDLVAHDLAVEVAHGALLKALRDREWRGDDTSGLPSRVRSLIIVGDGEPVTTR